MLVAVVPLQMDLLPELDATHCTLKLLDALVDQLVSLQVAARRRHMATLLTSECSSVS